MAFFIHGYSNPSDTIKKQNCLNGFSLEINGKSKCIDTTLLYYPISINYWNELDQYYHLMKSLNLQLLEETKWFNEDIKEDRLRIFLIEYPPSFDSIVLFSFFKEDCKNFKLTKKEMLIFNYSGSFMSGSMNLFIDSEKPLTVNYTQTEFMIHKRKMQKLIKQLEVIKNSDTFDRIGVPPSFVIEYVYRGNYYLLIAREPDEWCSTWPECRQAEKNCPRKSGLRIMKWLNKY